MKIAALHPASASGLDQSAATQETPAKAEAGQVDGKNAIDPEKLRLAREFEQIFIRKMLSSLEKSGRSMAGASASSSGDAYGSMVVSALAEAVSKGGGVGLAEVIARAASQQVEKPAASSAASPTAVADSTAATKASAAANVGPAGQPITMPHNVSIPLAPASTTVTYPRPKPAININQNHDIQESFKDRNR
jgi:Rod binding domain-containing protein